MYKHYTDAFTNQAPPNTVMILEAPIVTAHRATLLQVHGPHYQASTGMNVFLFIKTGAGVLAYTVPFSLIERVDLTERVGLT